MRTEPWEVVRYQGSLEQELGAREVRVCVLGGKRGVRKQDKDKGGRIFH